MLKKLLSPSGWSRRWRAGVPEIVGHGVRFYPHCHGVAFREANGWRYVWEPGLVVGLVVRVLVAILARRVA